MREIKEIWVHGSDSDFGDDNIIDFWHDQRGWGNLFKSGGFSISCGYHFVILNGNIHPTEKRIFALDGSIEVGRRISQQGAHVRGENKNSIGTCLIGSTKKDKIGYTNLQILSLLDLNAELMTLFDIELSGIKGHYEYWTARGETPKKNCPGFSMESLRELQRLYNIHKDEDKLAEEIDFFIKNIPKV